MALESPLFNPSSNMISALSPYTEFSMSPSSPAVPRSPRFPRTMSSRNSADSFSLKAHSLDNGLSPASHLMSPNDLVGPSPVTSNGTDATEIEDEAAEDVERTTSEGAERPAPSDVSKASTESVATLRNLNTSIPAHLRHGHDDEPTSVIHAPEGYGNYNNTQNTNPPQTPPKIDRSTPQPYGRENHSPEEMRGDLAQGDQTTTDSPMSPPPISTNVPPAQYGLENATPRAQTMREIEAMKDDKSRLRSSSSSSLEGIPEDQRETEDGVDEDFDAATIQNNSDEEANALKAALNECWTLCNTLASLSSIHRERIFSYSGTGDAHEKAWKCCWRLCQKLYDSRYEDHHLVVRPTLDLCRDFCQALFDVRQKDNEIADSVLRVSFELNNHLYNTHDRNLPEAFRERTLDFYITLCHRLMKQRSELAEETHSLLRACWSLAEMLFSLRQNRREGKPADEELLGSAVQACWELCDLFRKGWTQVRPERGTPRPSQPTFSQSYDQLSRSSHQPSSSISSLPSLSERAEQRVPNHYLPETPTTEFEDTPISPEDNSPSIPNILVLGTDNSRNAKTRWSSNSSNLSGYSQGSNKTSSTITNAGPEDANLTRLKILILKAAMNVGFSRDQSSSSLGGPQSGAPALQSFVKALPTGSFGSLPWHTNLLTAYKNVVLSDPTFRSASSLPPKGKKASANDVAKSVLWMMSAGQYSFLKDLFRLVFGFHVDEAETRKNVSISV